jgi:hypothetical protein
LYSFMSDSTCLGSNMKHSMTFSDKRKAFNNPVLSSIRKSLLNINKDLPYFLLVAKLNISNLNILDSLV